MIALQSPKVLNQMLFLKNIRMIFYGSVLREMASLLLSGGGSIALPYPIRLPQQSKAVPWVRSRNAERGALALLGSDTSATPLLLPLHITLWATTCDPFSSYPQKEQFLCHSHKQCIYHTRSSLPWAAVPFLQQHSELLDWLCWFTKAQTFQRRSGYEKIPLQLCIH